MYQGERALDAGGRLTRKAGPMAALLRRLEGTPFAEEAVLPAYPPGPAGRLAATSAVSWSKLGGSRRRVAGVRESLIGEAMAR